MIERDIFEPVSEHYYAQHGVFLHDFIVADKGNPQTFVVGAYADDAKRSFELMRKTADVLSNRIVDDVHIGRMFAEMITTVSAQIERRLTRFKPAATSASRSRAQSAAPGASNTAAIAPPPGRSNGNAPPVYNGWTGSNGHDGSLTPGSGALDYSNWNTNDTDNLLQNMDAFDPSMNGNMTLMPPPHLFMDNSGLGDASMNGWLTLDLQPMMDIAVNGGSNEVTSSSMGAMINGQDLLGMFVPNTDQHYDPSLVHHNNAHGMPTW
jgi:hypothetical protein